MVAQEIGLELLEKIQQGFPNVGAPTDLYFSTTYVQSYTPKDEVEKKKDSMGLKYYNATISELMPPTEDFKVTKEQYYTDGMTSLLYCLSTQNSVVL